MIFFLCLRRNAVPIRQYLRALWPQSPTNRIEAIFYDELEGFVASPGLYVFADIELLEDAERTVAADLHARLRAEPGRFTVWNDPRKTARRHEVLDTLWREGRNTFRACRVGEGRPADLRYPVFVRDEHEHTGSLTPLLADEAALEAAIAELRTGARPSGPLLVVEYLDYGDATGVFRKYSVFRAGERFIRKHVLPADNWMVKTPADGGRFLREEWLEEERRFLREEGTGEAELNGQLREIFEQFGVEYGRIDFAVVGGRVQVFEINTNPTILKPANFLPAPRLGVHLWFAERLDEALRLADPGAGRRGWRWWAWRLSKPKMNPTPWWRRLRPGWRGEEEKPVTANAAARATVTGSKAADGVVAGVLLAVLLAGASRLAVYYKAPAEEPARVAAPGGSDGADEGRAR